MLELYILLLNISKILVIGSVLKLKINTIILKIFYAVESDMVLRTTSNRVAKKNTQTVTEDTILANRAQSGYRIRKRNNINNSHCR